MARHLIDSDVIIWALRGRPETIRLLEALSADEALACSAISVLEVLLGAHPRERELVGRHLRAYEVLPVDGAVAEQAATLLRSSGRRIHKGEWADAAIAATAILHNIPVVTYNIRHFHYPGVVVYPTRP